MAKFLVSIADATEAEIALRAGADIIDLVPSADGGPDALDPQLVRNTVALVAGRGPVSVMAGFLPVEPTLALQAVEKYTGTGVEYVRIGVLPGRVAEASVRAAGSLADRVKLIAILFADESPDSALLFRRVQHHPMKAGFGQE